MSILDFERLEKLSDGLRDQFQNAEPFPHLIIDDFLPRDVAERIVPEFERGNGAWNFYHHYNEKKMALTDLADMGEHTRQLIEELQSRRFVDLVQRMTGLKALMADPTLEGGGMHQTLPGGALNMHTDFLVHTKHKTWSRQVNLLLYFNEGWQPEWQGNLELWDADMKRCVQSVQPLFNRCVMFHTREHSFHGHPHALACPEGMSRKSIALYYYRDEGTPQRVVSTNYQPLPTDPLHKRVLIALDRTLLRAYTVLKRNTPLSDRAVSRLLKRL